MPPHEPAPRLLVVTNQVADFLEYRLPFARALQGEGAEVHVALPRETGAEAIERLGLRVHFIHLRRLSVNPWFEMRSLVSIVRLYRRLRPALVFHLCLKPALYGGIAARLTGVPSAVSALMGLGPIFTARTPASNVLRGCVEGGLRFAFARRRHVVIVQNPDDREHLVARGIARREHTVFIPGSGVDLAVYAPRPEPEGAPVVLMASRLLREKGVEEFVAAAALLRRRGSRARFLLLGESERGHPGAVPVSTLERWRGSGDVEFLGWRRDMPSLMAGSHIVCLPSYYGEGLPRCLVEAAACGRAIVTIDAPGCREVVSHEDNGLLVPARDVAALANALDRLIRNPELRARLGRRGREIAESRFSLQRILDANVGVIRSLMDRPLPSAEAGPTVDDGPACTFST